MSWQLSQAPVMSPVHTGTTDENVHLGSGYLLSVLITAVAAGTVNIRDTALADGVDMSGENALIPSIILAGTEVPPIQLRFQGVRYSSGLGIELTATGISVGVEYSKDRSA